MTHDDRLSGLLYESRQNAVLSWVFVLLLAVLVGERIGENDPLGVLLALAVLAVVVIPPVALRDPTVMLPWDLLLIACLPILWDILGGPPFVTDVIPYVSVAVVALLLTVELHAFTEARMSHSFAIALVMLTTMAAAALWNVIQWLSDVFVGTTFLLDGRTQDAINAAVMIEFAYATTAGLLAGIVFTFFFRTRVPVASERTYVPLRSLSRGDRSVDPLQPVERRPLADRLRLSTAQQQWLTRSMEVLLVGVLFYGVWTLHLPTIANAALALAITFVPGILERDLELSMEPGLVLWITAAVFLHAIGTAGLYDLIDPWDNLTHALSASVVAAAGYAVFRAIDLHTDHVYIPPRLMFVLILVFVLAAGVIWELLEFVIDQTAIIFGIDAVLAQHGIDDTIVDLLFNSVGAVITALWGTIYLTGVSESLSERFGE